MWKFWPNKRESKDLIEAAEQLLRQGKAKKAEKIFRKILNKNIEHAEAHRGLMQAWLLQGNFQLVVERFDALPKKRQDEWQDLLLFGLALQVGHITRAGYLKWLRLPQEILPRLDEVRKMAEEFHKCGAISLHWAELALHLSLYDELEEALKQARAAQPPVPSKFLAHLYARRDALRLKRDSELKEVLERARSLADPLQRLETLLPMGQRELTYPPIQREIGALLLQLGRPDIALRYLNRAVDNNPFWIQAMLELSFSAILTGRFTRARDTIKRILNRQKSEWLGDIYQELEILQIQSPELKRLEPALDRLDTGDTKGAAEVLSEALEYNPERPETLWLIAYVHAEHREYREAIEYFAKALENSSSLSPLQQKNLSRQMEKAALSYAIAAIEQNSTDSAVSELESTIEQLKSPPPLLNQILLQLKKSPGDPSPLVHLREKLSPAVQYPLSHLFPPSPSLYAVNLAPLLGEKLSQLDAPAREIVPTLSEVAPPPGDTDTDEKPEIPDWMRVDLQKSPDPGEPLNYSTPPLILDEDPNQPIDPDSIPFVEEKPGPYERNSESRGETDSPLFSPPPNSEPPPALSPEKLRELAREQVPTLSQVAPTPQNNSSKKRKKEVAEEKILQLYKMVGEEEEKEADLSEIFDGSELEDFIEEAVQSLEKIDDKNSK